MKIELTNQQFPFRRNKLRVVRNGPLSSSVTVCVRVDSILVARCEMSSHYQCDNGKRLQAAAAITHTIS